MASVVVDHVTRSIFVGVKTFDKTTILIIRMRLEIHRVEARDFTSYKCVAKNSLGETDGKIRLFGNKSLTFWSEDCHRVDSLLTNVDRSCWPNYHPVNINICQQKWRPRQKQPGALESCSQGQLLLVNIIFLDKILVDVILVNMIPVDIILVDMTLVDMIILAWSWFTWSELIWSKLLHSWPWLT